MNMISVKEASEKWGVTPRYVQMACKDGLIEGAVQWGRAWMIPAEAGRPAGKSKGQEGIIENMPLPRKSLFLDMTSLYHTAGCAEEAIQGLGYNPEAQILFEAEIAYARGEIDQAYTKANSLLERRSGFYAVLASGILLGFCAMWRGDVKLWLRAKRHICEAPMRTDEDSDIMSLALAALNTSNYEMLDFPEWFKMGDFEPLHPDSLPAVKVFYAKYLYVASYAIASKQFEMKGIQGLTLMSIIPNTIEPMISQAIADKTVIAEIYLRLICASAYHNSGNNAQAIRHIDRAIRLALPDGLFGILAEHKKPLDTLLDERLAIIAPAHLEKFKELTKAYSIGWATLSGTVRNKKISTSLTAREREVAKLAAFGLSNGEIAEALHISVAAVKQAIRIAISKGGVGGRDELITIL